MYCKTLEDCDKSKKQGVKMLAIKIDNPEIENRFKQYAKENKKHVEELVSEALKMFLDFNKKETKLIYTKKIL